MAHARDFKVTAAQQGPPRYNAIMAQADFDIDRLAAYLHMSPAAVAKLADRGKLPARRVGGEWRFSAAEIHHWLEDKIGLSGDEELAQMEGALIGPPRPTSKQFPLPAF